MTPIIKLANANVWCNLIQDMAIILYFHRNEFSKFSEFTFKWLYKYLYYNVNKIICLSSVPLIFQNKFHIVMKVQHMSPCNLVKDINPLTTKCSNVHTEHYYLLPCLPFMQKNSRLCATMSFICGKYFMITCYGLQTGSYRHDVSQLWYYEIKLFIH